MPAPFFMLLSTDWLRRFTLWSGVGIKKPAEAGYNQRLPCEALAVPREGWGGAGFTLPGRIMMSVTVSSDLKVQPQLMFWHWLYLSFVFSESWTLLRV